MDVSESLPKDLLQRQRAFSPWGRGYNRDSRHAGGCGFRGMAAGASTHLNNGWGTGLQSVARCSVVSAPTHRSPLLHLGWGKTDNLIL